MINLISWRTCVAFASASVGALAMLFGQSSQGTGSNSQPDTEVAIHHLFFHNAAILSQKAAQLDLAGGNGAGLRRALATKLELSTQDAAALFSVATTLDAQFAALDHQAAAIIAAVKLQRQPGTPLPPVPQALIALDRARNALISSAVTSLTTKLTPVGHAALEAYLHSPPPQAAGTVVP